MKPTLHCLFACLAVMCLGLLCFSGCAQNQDRLEPNPQDPSRPNLASIYYYFSASFLHYSGDFNSAGQLYQRALEQDSASPQIKKQILINAAFAYVNGQLSRDEVLAAFSEARQSQKFDQDLLNAAYTVYSQANDTEGQEWCINETVTRFPSARAYLQKFYLSYTKDGSLDSESLNKAIKLAAGNHDDLVLAARMSSLTDPQQALSLLKKALDIDKRSDTQMLLIEMTLQYGTPETNRALFSGFTYPEDKPLQLHYLQQANKNRRLDQIIELKSVILNTADASLMGELAFAAYLKHDSATLTEIHRAVNSRPAEPESDSKLAIFLLANALVTDDYDELQSLPGMLYGIQDVDDMLLYHTLRQAITRQVGPQPDAQLSLKELATAAQAKLNNSLLSSYISAASSNPGTADPAFQTARTALCEEFVLSGRGHEADWSAVISLYHTDGRLSEKLSLLRKAISRFSDNPLFLNDLGYSLLDYPDSLTEAGLLITRAVSLEPDNPYYQDSLAWYYYLLGDFASAMKYIDLPRQMENPPGEIAYHIGMILRANNDYEAAKEYLQKALNDSSSPEYVQKAKQALE